LDEETLRLAAAIERALGDELPRARPKLRLITTADLPPRPTSLYTDDEREWVRDRIRYWTRIYQLEQWTRQQMRGFVTLEEMPDEDLKRLLDRVEHGVQCIRDEVPFDEAGIA
jgi:hypothetical protein